MKNPGGGQNVPGTKVTVKIEKNTNKRLLFETAGAGGHHHAWLGCPPALQKPKRGVGKGGMADVCGVPGLAPST
jgi:hypothetical protein